MDERRDRFYACRHVAAGAEMKAYLLLDPGPVHSFIGVRMCAECRDAVPALLEASEQLAPQLCPKEASEADTTVGSGELAEKEILGALSRAVCVCGHLLQEHAPQWCRTLSCECRTYRAAESAS